MRGLAVQVFNLSNWIDGGVIYQCDKHSESSFFQVCKI